MTLCEQALSKLEAGPAYDHAQRLLEAGVAFLNESAHVYISLERIDNDGVLSLPFINTFMSKIVFWCKLSQTSPCGFRGRSDQPNRPEKEPANSSCQHD